MMVIPDILQRLSTLSDWQSRVYMRPMHPTFWIFRANTRTAASERDKRVKISVPSFLPSVVNSQKMSKLYPFVSLDRRGSCVLTAHCSHCATFNRQPIFLKQSHMNLFDNFIFNELFQN